MVSEVKSMISVISQFYVKILVFDVSHNFNKVSQLFRKYGCCIFHCHWEEATSVTQNYEIRRGPATAAAAAVLSFSTRDPFQGVWVGTSPPPSLQQT